MDFAFTEEQEALRATARSFLSDHAGSEKARAAMESALGYDPELWKRIGSELGWCGVAIPEQEGGLGLGQVELAALCEVMGEALLCAPFFSSVCLAANALLLAGSSAQREELLPRIAEGQTTATLACAEPAGLWSAEGLEATASRRGDGYRLSGRKRYVVDGHSAEWLIVAARAEGSVGEEGVSLFCLPAASEGLVRRALPTLDRSRRLAEIELRDCKVPASARMGDEGAAWPALATTLDRAAVALAAELVGGAQRCLDLSVAHAKERVQFGRAIGAFQAIKHKCADMMVRVEAARSAVYYAACVAAEEGEALSRAASMAKAVSGDAGFRNAADALQIHGGVGFTWEYDVHLYLKRARGSRALLGSGDVHRERVARQIGLGDGT